jgi:hypothetical protein
VVRATRFLEPYGLEHRQVLLHALQALHAVHASDALDKARPRPLGPILGVSACENMRLGCDCIPGSATRRRLLIEECTAEMHIAMLQPPNASRQLTLAHGGLLLCVAQRVCPTSKLQILPCNATVSMSRAAYYSQTAAGTNQTRMIHICFELRRLRLL